MALCIGLDAHAKTCVYQVKDGIGRSVDSGTIPSTPTDLAIFADRYPGVCIIIEASGVSEWIYDLLAKRGMKPVLCHPMNIRRILGKKRDDIDAGFLIDTYRLGCLPLSWVPPVEIRTLRQLTRRCSFLTNERTRLKNRVHGILKRKGLRLIDDKTQKAIYNIFLKKHRPKLLSIEDPEIPILLDIIDTVNEKRNEADKALLLEVDQNPDVQNLMTIPGFGPLVSIAIYAEIGDVNRFRRADSLGAYFGLVPAESQSGETLIRGHITRRGSSLVRWLLNQASWNHIRLCPESSVSKKYRRIVKRVGKKRAITAVSRTLVTVSYCLLKEKRSFTTKG